MTSLKKKLATGLVIAGLTASAGTIGLAFHLDSSRSRLEEEYAMRVVKQIEWDRKDNSNFNYDFPELARAYEEITSREGYEEAREKYSSNRKVSDLAPIGFLFLALGGIKSAFWRRDLGIEEKARREKEQNDSEAQI